MTMGSIQTSPVNHSAGALLDGLFACLSTGRSSGFVGSHMSHPLIVSKSGAPGRLHLSGHPSLVDAPASTVRTQEAALASAIRGGERAGNSMCPRRRTKEARGRWGELEESTTTSGSADPVGARRGHCALVSDHPRRRCRGASPPAPAGGLGAVPEGGGVPVRNDHGPARLPPSIPGLGPPGGDGASRAAQQGRHRVQPGRTGGKRAADPPDPGVARARAGEGSVHPRELRRAGNGLERTSAVWTVAGGGKQCGRRHGGSRPDVRRPGAIVSVRRPQLCSRP